MILKGSQRGGARQLALHLLNTRDNDRVEVHSIDGLVAGDVEGALTEIYAISRATNCKQFMFSLSLSPPRGETVSVEDYEAAIAQAAKRLRLQGQPKVVIFHEKEGRRHAHVVFSRIDGETLKAINLPFFKERLNGLSHELFLTHGWKMPEGLRDRGTPDPLNYSLEEYQVSKRAKAEPQKLKVWLRGCWEHSDGPAAFSSALRERGYVLCRGNRRGFVLLDRNGNVLSLSRWLGEAPRALRARLGDPKLLPSLDEQRQSRSAQFRQQSGSTVAHADAVPGSALAALQKQLARMDERHGLERLGLERDLADIHPTQPDHSPTFFLSRLWQRMANRSADIPCPSVRADTVRYQLQQMEARHAADRSALTDKIEKIERKGCVKPRLKAALADIDLSPSAEELRVHRERTARVRRSPEAVLDLITEHKARFTRTDIARTLHRYIDDPDEFQTALAKATSAKALVCIPGKPVERKKYFSTHEILEQERRLMADVTSLAASGSHKVSPRHVKSVISKQDRELRDKFGASLSQEQRHAIVHVTGQEQLSVIVGLAGAGKSTALAAVRAAYEKQGFRVMGAALAGKAADELQRSSGITSRTLASLELGWQHGHGELDAKTVLVIDEAGMVGTKQLARFVGAVKTKGAKIVLVGDPEQLQPIAAGTPLRDIVEKVGSVRLEEIRRQNEDWQRQASRDLAEGRTEQALAAYEDQGLVHHAETHEQARAELAEAYLQDWQERGADASRLALAHRRKDVRLLNAQIRSGLKDMGELGDEIAVQTQNGRRAFAPGDRIVFLRNDRDIGVRNGTIGKIKDVTEGRISVQMEDTEKPKVITFSWRDHNAVDHGYATTIHKSQGSTVERTFILASKSMDRHLQYVAMTRHKSVAAIFQPGEMMKNAPTLTQTMAKPTNRMRAVEPIRLQTPELKH